VVLRGAGDNAWKIGHIETGSKFRALANGDAVSGQRPPLRAIMQLLVLKSRNATWACISQPPHLPGLSEKNCSRPRLVRTIVKDVSNGRAEKQAPQQIRA